MELREIIERERVSHKLTYRKMAKMLGISAPYLCDIVKKNRKGTVKILARFAKVFGIDINALIYYECKEFHDNFMREYNKWENKENDTGKINQNE